MFNQDKFKDLVHYICWLSRDDPSKLGAVKLNKVLWFSEVISFAKFAKPITGARFVKQKFGPVPKAILPVLNDLQQDGLLSFMEVEYYGHRKRQFVCEADPNTDAFSDEERELVDEVAEAILNNHTAASISDLTHDAIWKLAGIGEDIPLHAVLASSLGTISDEDVANAKTRMAAVAA